MFNVGGGEFLIILLVALVVLGPQKLPEAARQVGKMVGEFRRISAGFQREMQTAMKDPVSKVTGEPTPTSFTDVTKVAELPPDQPAALTDHALDHHATEPPSSAADAAPDYAAGAEAEMSEPDEPPMHGDK